MALTTWLLLGLGAWSVLGLALLYFVSNAEIRSRWVFALVLLLSGPLSWVSLLVLTKMFRNR
jgi:hypothetical protein